jgi:hypothetical protein
MGTRRTAFTATGVANTTVHSSTFQSTEAQPKTVVAVEVATSGLQGNLVEIWIDQDKYQDIYDYNLRTYSVATGDSETNGSPITSLTVNKELVVGQQLTVAINSGGTLTTIYGAIVWEDRSER